MQLTLFNKAPKYTFSRKTKHGALSNQTSPSKQGIGWSDAGLEKYNELYDLVVEDRVSRGAVFNNELLNVFIERRRERNAKPDRAPESKRQKVVPKDDMGPYDTSYANVLVPIVTREFHPSMQML